MTISLGRSLSIRSSVYVAGKPIPFFWPMRAFIHHNPLHGLEHMPFDEAVVKAQKLFHSKTYLPREQYQSYLAEGQVCKDTLTSSAQNLAKSLPSIDGIHLDKWFVNFFTHFKDSEFPNFSMVSGESIFLELNTSDITSSTILNAFPLKERLKLKLSAERPLYESIDLIYGTDIGQELDELVIKSCLEFFDEGQSVWGMPSREEGFFKAWSDLATRNQWTSKRARFIKKVISTHETAEGVIESVMNQLKVPEDVWMSYFTAELSRLHGWVGFMRWRESAKNYYWRNRYPADLVEYLAVRLTLSLALINEQRSSVKIKDLSDLEKAIEDKPEEVFLRYELYSGEIYAPMAQEVEEALLIGHQSKIDTICRYYIRQKNSAAAESVAQWLSQQANLVGESGVLESLSADQFNQLLANLIAFKNKESQLWLEAMEQHAMNHLLSNMSYHKRQEREKRPFAQALFCIDTRSEPIRRRLESVGDYETYGIAGFFGVPFSFLELGKGSENHLCPILLTPKNLVLEIPLDEQSMDAAAISTLEKAVYELKQSIIAPFVTVEAIGFIFGFDMVGKTFAPRTYSGWRKHLHKEKPVTYLLQDKLSREQADSVVRTVQRSVIENALEIDLLMPKELITDDLVRELREAALGHEKDYSWSVQTLADYTNDVTSFIDRLKTVYNISSSMTRRQLERLARIGFSLEEQAGFVSQSLRSIGLVKDFSRFVLLTGHGSQSENNPYESALDCGACGGNHGLVNARVLAKMANKPQVRSILRKQGIIIDDDVCFVPALHNTTTDSINLYDLDFLPSSHLLYLDRLRNGLIAATRLCAQERLLSLQEGTENLEPGKAVVEVQRNSMDWSQVRPEWGLSRNAYFIVAKRDLTLDSNLEGRSFLHSYDYLEDSKRRLLENILTGPLVVGQWINMEHYFSTVDNERLGSGSKAYHNVAGRFGVMTGNISDLRTGLPAQTVLNKGQPYHEPMRLITVIEAPFDHAWNSILAVVSVKRLVKNEWIRLIILDPETQTIHSYEHGEWIEQAMSNTQTESTFVEE